MADQGSQGAGNLVVAGVPPALRCADGSRPRLLLAEDSVTARILTAALLKRMGAEVDAVEHGEEALDHVRNNDYDLVLLDIEMPVMDGMIAAREIRALDGRASKTPLMALSAFLADSAKCSSWRESFDHAISKPAGRAELHSAIQFVLNTKGASRLAPAMAEKPADATLLIDKTAMQQAKEQISAALWNEILPVAIDEMNDSMKAIEAIVASGQRPLLIKQAHKLKGIARSFAAPLLAAQAEAFELACAAAQVPALAEQCRPLRKAVTRTAAALLALNAN